LDGQFLGKDLLASITAPLARALPFSVPVPKEEGVTNLGKELGLAIGLEKGFAQLKSPIQINRPEANLTLSGGARLNGALDLAGTAALSPETISALTQGKVRVSQPVPIAFKLTGPVWKPVVSDIDLKGAVESIVKQSAAGALTGVLGKAGASTTAAGRQQTQALRERASSEEQAVKEKAQQEQQRTEEAARSAAEKARKQAEDEAGKRLKGLLGR
jgi:AsmA protein